MMETIKDELKQSAIYFGKSMYCIFDIFKSLLKISAAIILRFVHNRPFVSLGIMSLSFIFMYAIIIGKYRIANDVLSHRVYVDSERIYRLQNDSIALHNLSKQGVKHDTVIVIKKIKIIQKRDSL